MGHLLEVTLATLDSIVCEARAHAIHLRGIRPHLAEASVHITRALEAAKTRAHRLDPNRTRKRNTRRKSRVRR